jgi:hypothetical protein
MSEIIMKLQNTIDENSVNFKSIDYLEASNLLMKLNHRIEENEILFKKLYLKLEGNRVVLVETHRELDVYKMLVKKLHQEIDYSKFLLIRLRREIEHNKILSDYCTEYATKRLLLNTEVRNNINNNIISEKRNVFKIILENAFNFIFKNKKVILDFGHVYLVFQSIHYFKYRK